MNFIIRILCLINAGFYMRNESTFIITLVMILLTGIFTDGQI